MAWVGSTQFPYSCADLARTMPQQERSVERGEIRASPTTTHAGLRWHAYDILEENAATPLQVITTAAVIAIGLNRCPKPWPTKMGKADVTTPGHLAFSLRTKTDPAIFASHHAHAWPTCRCIRNQASAFKRPGMGQCSSSRPKCLRYQYQAWRRHSTKEPPSPACAESAAARSG